MYYNRIVVWLRLYFVKSSLNGNSIMNNFYNKDISKLLLSIISCLISNKKYENIINGEDLKKLCFLAEIHNLSPIVYYVLQDRFELLAKENDKTAEELKKKYVKTYYAKFNKEAYTNLKADFNNDKSDLFRLYLLLIFGFNHMLRFNSAGDFNLPVGNVDFNNNVYKSLNAYFDFMANNSVEFACLDFRNFFKKKNLNNSDFVYIDPPYLISSSEYNKNWNEKEECELLSLIDELNSKGIKFALSNVFEHKGLKNNILIEWAKKYNVFTVSSNYISYYDNSIKKDTIEVLITNY